MNRLILRTAALSAFALLIASANPVAAGITFSTFVQSSAIDAATGGNNSTIAITYAGNKFVGSVYYGTNNNQLFQTDLNGGNVQAFGALIPGASGEVVVGASLGLDGFAKGNIFAGSQSNGQIYQFSNDGSTQSLFTTLTGENVRQIFFDPGSSFGGKMIVTTASGDIYTVNSAGTATLLAAIGVDTEGMDIAPSSWGPFAGQLLVASEGSGLLRFIDNLGNVTSTGISIPEAETVSFVPSNIGVSGNPVEGFYVANYPVDVQKAGASQFTTLNLQDHLIVTSEDPSNARVWNLEWNGTSIVNLGVDGNLPNQSEDGIFVTAERVQDLSVPEPSTLVVWSLIAGFFGVGGLRKRLKQTAITA